MNLLGENVNTQSLQAEIARVYKRLKIELVHGSFGEECLHAAIAFVCENPPMNADDVEMLVRRKFYSAAQKESKAQRKKVAYADYLQASTEALL